MKTNINYHKNQSVFIENSKNKKFLIFIASKTKINLEDFNKNDISIIGARFPDIIFNGKMYDDGIISLEINTEIDFTLIKSIENFNFKNEPFFKSEALITILDGFCKDNEIFLSKLFENVSLNTNIIGGGAGLLNNDCKSVIFDNHGYYRNCAILISLNANLKVSARHGWTYLDGPFIVTSSERNILKTIDYIDAFEYYKNIIKKDSGIELNKENFLEVSQNYPIGIIKYQGEQIVRDPISFNNGHLELLGEISNNSMINILKGNTKNLLSASKEAIDDIKSDCSDFLIVFNCISRKKFLKNEFQKELDSISIGNNMIGVTTLGEIANCGSKYINFLNKTCVIGDICS